jgi:hypothetical protein
MFWKSVGYDVTMATATIEAAEPGGGSPGDALVSSLVSVLPALSSDPASVTASERSEVVVALASAVGRVEALLGQFANVAGANLDHVVDGAKTEKAWVASHTQLSHPQVGRVMKLDRDLDRYPLLAGAWRSGRLGTEKIRTILASAGHVEAMLERDQQTLIDKVAGMTVNGARGAIRLWREGALAELSESPDDPAPEDPVVNSAKVRAGVGTERTLSGVFDAVTGGEIAGLLEGEVDRSFRTRDFTADDGLTGDERTARALLALLRRGSQVETEGGEPKRAISIVVDLRWLLGLGGRADNGDVTDWPCELADGTPVPLAQVLASLDDATINLVLGTLGLKAKAFKPVGEITTQRLANASQRRLLRARDRVCVWPGCDAPATWCQAHHEPPFEETHRTTTSELVLLCRHHHTLRHNGGFDLRVTPDGTVTIHRPDGSLLPYVAPGHLQPFPHPDPPPERETPPGNERLPATDADIDAAITQLLDWVSAHDGGPPERAATPSKRPKPDQGWTHVQMPNPYGPWPAT